MNIGVDLDGIIADVDPVFRFYIKKLLDREVPQQEIISYQYEDCLGLTKEQMKKLWDLFINGNGWEKIPIIEGAIPSLKKLSQQHQLFIITSRPVEFEAVTQKWLMDNNVPHTKLIMTGGKSKARVAQQLAITHFIEDRLEFALELAREGIEVFLFDYPWNQTDEKYSRLHRISGWEEIEKLFTPHFKSSPL